MIFSSYEFLLVFLPIVWLVHVSWGNRQPAPVRNSWLVAASLAFYSWWHPPNLVILVASVLANLAASHAIFRASHALRPALLSLGVLGNLALLAAYKYSGWLVETYNAINSSSIDAPGWELPLAISFFTFQQITYLLSVYRGELAPARSIDYALFVMFFPQLIAGPIVHHREFLPQISDRPIRIGATKHAIGTTLICLGLVKKLIIADRLGAYYDIGHAAVLEGIRPALLDSWLLMITASFHIYFDYSAYADIACGLALLFGLRLPLSFYSPFKAESFADFWRRWNMTLMRFLKDSIYVPLGGSRHGTIIRLGAIMATMILCGIWHGSGWNFVVWGAVLGLLMIAERLLGGATRPNEQGRNAWKIGASRARVLMMFTFPLALLTFTKIADGSTVLSGMLGFHGLGIPLSIQAADFSIIRLLQGLGVAVVAPVPITPSINQLLLLTAAFGLIYAAPNTYELVARFRPVASPPRFAQASRFRWRPTLAWATASGLLLIASFIHINKPKEFFYFQF